MKKILIVIHDMEIGGAQKSLLSFCQAIAASDASKEYEIDLIPINPTGPFMAQLPNEVHLKEPPKELRWVGTPFSRNLMINYFSLRSLIGEVLWIVCSRLGIFHKKWNLQQKLWASWRNLVPKLEQNYDVAISYMDGVSSYYVMEKVNAPKKALWFHSEYQKQGYDPQFDQKYYGRCDSVVTISERCRECLLQEFSQYKDKIHVLENITVGRVIENLSREYFPEEYRGKSCLKILSVGRLNPQKGFDMAILGAKELDKKGLDFFWWIIGDGKERFVLQNMIEKEGLAHRIQLLGARENPYPYICHCDILVQPSRIEGKSIVLDEAKILCKPIVATNYTTVSASLEHGVSGWIVDMSPCGIAEGIQTLYENPAIREQLYINLEKQVKGNEAELEKYIKCMF